MRNIIIGFAAACLLSACGGGSTGSSSSTSVAVNTPKSDCEAEGRRFIDAISYCTSLRTMTRSDFYDTVALIRSSANLPPLVVDARVEDAAFKHANYLYVNNTIGHDQVIGKPGFYGVKEEDRLWASQYPATGADEDAAATSDIAAGFEGLLSVPYHASLFLKVGPYHMGLGIAGDATGKGGMVVDVANTSSQYTILPKDTLSIYPCGLSSISKRSIADEAPAPYPGRNLRTDPIGSLIIMQVPYAQGNNLQVINISLSETVSKAGVAIAQPANLLDSSIRIYNATKPLKSTTSYSINVDGFLSGVAYKRSCTFSTGI